MMEKITGYGLFGGIDILSREDRTLDPDEAEKLEQPRRKTEDELDNVLTEILGRGPGGRINQYMIDVEVPGSRNIQVEFDRYYFDLHLIVDMMQLPLNDADGAENAKRIAQHQQYATALNAKYLAIQGSASLEQIMLVLN